MPPKRTDVLYHALSDPSGHAFTFDALGIHEPMPPEIVSRPGGHPWFLFMLFHQETELGTPEGVHPVPANTLMIWTPEDPQHYGIADRPWEHSWLHFSGDLVHTTLREAGVPHYRPRILHDPGMFEWYLTAIHREITAHYQPHWRIVANLMVNLIYEIAREAEGGPGASRVPEPFVQLRAQLERDYSQSHTLESLARQVHLSVPHFCRLFRQYFGLAPIEFIQRQRMQHATRLLTNRNLRVGEVAAQVGYRDIYQFSRMFKRHFGVSPTQLREQESGLY